MLLSSSVSESGVGPHWVGIRAQPIAAAARLSFAYLLSRQAAFASSDANASAAATAAPVVEDDGSPEASLSSSLRVPWARAFAAGSDPSGLTSR